MFNGWGKTPNSHSIKQETRIRRQGFFNHYKMQGNPGLAHILEIIYSCAVTLDAFLFFTTY